ncbi:MAG TPA: sulfotransferase [Acidimicrobiales bacterium]|nr:sulfotransferase [Acidimicrobiales bacterium]
MPTADQLVDEACRQTGLEDFGGDSFREGLAIYCDSLDREAQLNEIGSMAVPGTIVAALSNRLRVVDWAGRHPSVASERIDAPLIVIGMFRAGTTFLSNLLDQDAGNRALLLWESADSVPPASAADHRAGPRIDAAREQGGMLEQLNPRMRAVHHEEADGPTECIAVMSQDFKSLSWEAIANVPAYGSWLFQTDQRSAYEYHRLVLQVLQSGGVRGRWTLKSPHHAIALDALTAVYPDARLVLLHRDPVVLCASVCSLISTLSSTFSDADHRAYIAAHWTAMLEESIRRIDAFRRAHPEHRILDVHYADLVQEPLATVDAIYSAFGDRLDDRAMAAMTTYVDANPKGKFGVHGYDLGQFGLDGDELGERFAEYVARHDIPTERAAQMT